MAGRGWHRVGGGDRGARDEDDHENEEWCGRGPADGDGPGGTLPGRGRSPGGRDRGAGLGREPHPGRPRRLRFHRVGTHLRALAGLHRLPGPARAAAEPAAEARGVVRGRNLRRKRAVADPVPGGTVRGIPGVVRGRGRLRGGGPSKARPVPPGVRPREGRALARRLTGGPAGGMGDGSRVRRRRNHARRCRCARWRRRGGGPRGDLPGRRRGRGVGRGPGVEAWSRAGLRRLRVGRRLGPGRGGRQPVRRLRAHIARRGARRNSRRPRRRRPAADAKGPGRHEGRGVSAGRVGDPATMPGFPRLEARSLNGRTYRLPGDLEGENKVVIVGFEWWQQELIDSWVPFLEELVRRRPRLRFYELVAVSRLRLPARGIIDGGMAAGIPDRRVRARTLTTYTDLRGLLAGLDLGGTQDVAAFLTGPAGRISWRATSAHDDARQADLEGALGLG